MPADIESIYVLFAGCALSVWALIHLLTAVWPRKLAGFCARDPFMLVGAWRMFSLENRDQAGWIELEESVDGATAWRTVRSSRMDWRLRRTLWAPDAYATQQMFRQGMLLHARHVRLGKAIHELEDRQCCVYFRRLASVSGSEGARKFRVVLVSYSQTDNESRRVALYEFQSKPV